MKKILPVITIILAVLFLYSSLLAQINVKKEFFSGRRTELLKQIDKGVLILSGGKTQVYRNSDGPFKQDDNFWYLTGYSSPDAFCLLAPNAKNKFVLIIKKMYSYQRPGSTTPKRDFLKETMENYGADTAYFAEDLENVVKRYAAGAENVFCSKMDKDLYNIVQKYTKNEASNSAKKITDPTELISNLRIIKTPEEIDFIKKAADITTKAEIEAMKASKPGLNEKVIEAVIDFIYKVNGSSGFGFPSIVGSGPNSLVLHYMDNNNEMKNGTVCVLDIGAAYNGYSADITRTIPVNGVFTKEQKEIYNAVLKCQKESVKLFKPGTLPQAIEDAAANTAKEELYKLGLITDKDTKWQHLIWYLHGCSHSIGLDVHDATPMAYYKNGLKPNMIFTLEPGIYISETALDNASKIRYPNVTEQEMKDFIDKVRPIAKKYNNIGVRIEDDILITKDGYENITAKCPKEIADVEKTMKQKSRFVN